MKLKKTTKCTIWFSLAVLSFAYDLIVGADGGFHLSFIWFWALCGVVCLAGGLLTCKYGALPLPAPLKTAIFVLFFLALALFLLVEAQIVFHMADTGGDDLDCIIVLGAGVHGDRPSRALRFRIDAACAYLTAHPGTFAVLSGGRGAGENITEAECMFRELTARGIKGERLILEEDSRDTKENIRNSLALLDAMDRPQKVGILTASYHVYRALALAQAQNSGYEIRGIAAAALDPLLLHFTVREFAGVLAEWAEGNMSVRLF